MGRTKMKTNRKHNQRGITLKLNMGGGGQSFLQATHCLYRIHITIKFHEDIPTDNQVMGVQE